MKEIKGCGYYISEDKDDVWILKMNTWTAKAVTRIRSSSATFGWYELHNIIGHLIHLQKQGFKKLNHLRVLSLNTDGKDPNKTVLPIYPNPEINRNTQKLQNLH